MKKLYILFAILAAVSCGTSNTQNNDPWGKVDPEKAAAQSKVLAELSMQSVKMGRSMTYSVWLPAEFDESKTYPFLYLLHGYETNDQNAHYDRCWLDKGNAAKIADDYQKAGGVPMVIIMPNGLDKFYTSDGYEDYFEQELMKKVEADYHCNGKRAIAGLSMGGYGTLYHALKYPDKFTYAYAMSPAAQTWMSSFIDAQADKSVFPAFTIEVGEQDYTVNNADAKSLYNAMVSKGLTAEYISRAGTHDWVFWKQCLPKTLVAVGNSF
ncbi:MAG: hypothetical protein IK031_01555 [Bacteroidales bacterium]|nr:hypothetical protein [Bacteroidales bacterium]